MQSWPILPSGLPYANAGCVFSCRNIDRCPNIIPTRHLRSLNSHRSAFNRDDDCEWLRKHGTPRAIGSLNQYERVIQPSAVEELALETRVQLPRSFSHLMCAPERQSRVRSCTYCYVDPGERIVETIGAIHGHLVHLLSDSQPCPHWYLHVLSTGETAVLESPDLHCYQIEHSNWIENPSCRLRCVELAGSDFAYCAPSFSDFLFRFWIENEIWFALVDNAGRRPLCTLQLDYVSHYSGQR